LFLNALLIFSLSAATTAWADYTWEGVPTGYGLAWSDEFNGTTGSAPSSSNWAYDTGATGWGNNELENYTASRANSQIVIDSNAVDGKSLAIIAIDTTPGSPAYSTVGRYTSARLVSSVSSSGSSTPNVYEQYGYMEARVKMPYGQGIWPAFWMLGNNTNAPSNTSWPNCGEIDIMENIGNSSDQPVNHGSLHDGTDYTQTFSLPGGQLFHNAYHTFGALWQANEIQFYVDGNLYETQTSAAPWVFNGNNFFFLLNCAVGGNFPGSPNSSTSFPQTMYVDYVRAYQSGIPTPTPVVQSTWRVHCGGDNYTDGLGNLWSADSNFTGGWPSASGSGISDSVQPTAGDQTLYQWQRYGNSTGGETVTYTFNVPTGIPYQVTLKFAEAYFSSAGQRQFNYSINGVTEASNFDIYSTAGGANRALDEAYNSVYPNGSGQIVVQFTQGSADNPTVGGIQVIPQSSVPTATPTNTPCGFPGNTCTPTMTPTVTLTPTVTQTPTVTVSADEKPWLWPNPYYGNGTLNLEVPLVGVSDVHVSIFTLAFRKISDQIFSQQPAGLQQLTLSVVDKNQTALANGLYYIRVATSSGQKTIKLLILR
jgi:beta-glucanase (GH16 family)